MMRRIRGFLSACVLGWLVLSCGTGRDARLTRRDSPGPNPTSEVRIPEMYELANIAVALTRVGPLDSNMVDMGTPYYRRAMEHFRPFADHALIDTLNNHIRVLGDMDGYWYYYAVTMNACAYEFDGDRIVAPDPGVHLGFDNVPDPVMAHRDLFEDFARESGFRDFHRENTPYYDSLKVTYRDLNPLEGMQQWLEERFGFGYASYTICFGPLVGGAHSTTSSRKGRTEHTTMFVSRAERFPDLGENLNRMIHSRVVFTEIDHNFVNPVSHKLRRRIGKALKDREAWVNDALPGATAYGNAESVFNEYMTWSLFSLYCMDRYPEADVLDFLPRMERQMVEDRGFVRFREFNRELLELHRRDPAAEGRTLVKAMVDWCARREPDVSHTVPGK
jgi:hypothetical protein